MSKAKWIWYDGEFEVYHNLLLHCRREDYGMHYPCIWYLNRPYAVVNFKTTASLPCDTVLTARTHGEGYIYFGSTKYRLNTEITLPAGEYTVKAAVTDIIGFPDLFIDSEHFVTDSSWQADFCNAQFIPVGCTPEFTSEHDNPTVFPFSYAPLTPLSVSEQKGGLLYDFGREQFGPVVITAEPTDEIRLQYGETPEEALDDYDTIVCETLIGDYEPRRPARAFRYLFVRNSGAHDFSVQAYSEYLPLQDIARFECDNPEIKKIWDACSYTFHLNSREFFLDGIKRDRWVWSGDAYQSFMINNYLYFDPEITKRTITALLGKPPYLQHINTINDYSMYLIISVLDYFEATGDADFVRRIYYKVKALYDFIVGRLDENGFVYEWEPDWVFIDWSDIDKTGAVAAEQILLWKTMLSMQRISSLCGDDSTDYAMAAEQLRTKINEYFWDEQQGAYIDSFQSGRRHISRHANIFAVLYDFANAATQQRLLHTVLLNDEITQITTPYFRFYELMAMCKLGRTEYAKQFISSYWGGMIRLGATTIWEEFDPEKSGIEHYGMYGAKFGKSLCHAWGSGPIYLLGRYFLGVYPTDVAYKSFEVAPNTTAYSSMHGVVPIKDGRVQVDYENGELRVTADREGGTLVVGERRIALPAGVKIVEKV